MSRPIASQTSSRKGRDWHPLLRFRVAAVAVIAANRLRRLGLHTSHVTTVYDALPGVHTLSVCVGGMQVEAAPTLGKSDMCGLCGGGLYVVQQWLVAIATQTCTNSGVRAISDSYFTPVKETKHRAITYKKCLFSSANEMRCSAV